MRYQKIFKDSHICENIFRDSHSAAGQIVIGHKRENINAIRYYNFLHQLLRNNMNNHHLNDKHESSSLTLRAYSLETKFQEASQFSRLVTTSYYTACTNPRSKVAAKALLLDHQFSKIKVILFPYCHIYNIILSFRF